MRSTLCRNCLGLLALPLLSGCLLVNAFLGVAGLVGTGPIQYASTAYSVGEYAYQYAVNDKTPDEVIEEKLAFFIGPFDDEGEAAEVTQLAQLGTRESKSIAHTALGTESSTVFPTHSLAPVDVKTTPNTVKPTPIDLAAAPTPSPRKLVPLPAPRRIVAAHAAPVRPARPRPKAATGPVRPAPSPSVPAAVAPQPVETDPVLARMHRLERCLADAERIALARPENGLRLPVATEDAGQTAPEMSGGWSIRHPVMSFPDAG